MEITGEERIAARREAVWVALNDPETLKACIPGCQSLTVTEPGVLEAVVKVRIGPLSATFSGTVTLSNVNPPESYTLAAEGKGGIAGFAKGIADVRLLEDGEETILAYEARAAIGGRLTKIGSGLLASTTGKLAARFFSDLGKRLEDGQSA